MKTNIHSIPLDTGLINRDVKTYATDLQRARYIENIKSFFIVFIILATMSIVGAIETGVLYVP